MTQKSKILGILGGGQLGRMSALAAARLGIRVHIYCPEQDSPASFVAAKTFIGAYENQKKLKEFAESVDVISYEFENIPVETVRFLQKHKPVFPDDKLLEIAQHRVKEKSFLNSIGIETARFKQVKSPADIDAWKREHGESFIIKTCRFGYDGKGQISCKPGDKSEDIWAQLKTDDAIIEERVDFKCEISVIVARDKIGQTAIYGPVLNEHKHHILSKSTVPAGIPDHLAQKARDMTVRLAEGVDLVGVLALELFLTNDGRILANEIAPRTHNSGHWTIDACAVSQFEQHVRTVCGLPVGSPARHSDCEMYNLLGKDVLDLEKWLEMDGACVHLYGKEEIKDGRKLGHITVLKSN